MCDSGYPQVTLQRQVAACKAQVEAPPSPLEGVGGRGALGIRGKVGQGLYLV